MWSLFSTNPETSGYRLQYMEIFNWGTFDGRIFRVNPQGNNSLLTGANGSGKTTLVDALLTLLVPVKRHRFYNQSSGAEKKGDRSEETYVLGNYGDIQEEGKSGTTVQQLRNNKKTAYSIILANFKNSEDQTITVFQARWFVGGEMKRSFGIAHVALTIENDFKPFDGQGNWRKILEKRHNTQKRAMIEFFDGPTKYADRMVKLFGMRSIKALSLFNQTVGIKVLGNLDEFVRTNMLEQRESEDEFIKLKDNFNTLIDAQNNIDKAAAQIGLLKPINEVYEEVKRIRKDQEEYTHLKDAGLFYFADRGAGYIREELMRNHHQLTDLQAKKKMNEEDEEKLKEDEANIRVSIQDDEVGKRVAAIDNDVRLLQKEKEERYAQYQEYSHLVQVMGLPDSADEETFNKNKLDCDRKMQEMAGKAKEVEERIFEVKKKSGQLESRLEETSEEFESLQGRTNNIPRRVADIRDMIVEAVGADREDIPFVGELIQVDPEESAWESAIERLLHNFALRLIVPDEFYDEVNRFVNSTHLGGRIVYQRYQEGGHLNRMRSPDSDSVYHKLEFNQDSPYVDWVEEQIIENYDYICTDDLATFKKCRKAITVNGLIKNAGRHEKDDRPKAASKDRYVLGWDNRGKLSWIREQIMKIEKEIDQQHEDLEAENRRKVQYEGLKENYNDLKKFYQGFEDINWKSSVAKIQDLEREKLKLEHSNDRLRDLNHELGKVRQALAENSSAREFFIKEIALKEERVKVLEKEVGNLEPILALKKDSDNLEEFYEKIEKSFPQLSNLNYENYHQLQKEVVDALASKEENLDKQVMQKDQLMYKLMLDYKRPKEDITSKYKDWVSEAHNLPEKAEFVEEYITLLTKLIEEDLPRYKSKFEQYLTETLTHKIGDFKAFLEGWQDSILENLDALNDALSRINFKNNPQTYIQLKTEDKSSPTVREFRALLNAAIPDFAEWAVGENFDQKKEHFNEKIIPLILRLEENIDWRREVTDVRNWRSYYAEEYYRETNERMKSYVEMGKLSGGEKAQLTYTILGSAIAYQFGMTNHGIEPQSFRFIAVDESFSNQDDEKATYLMDLCKQLHLQLLVVTPSDRIHIVEPYISYVHLVQRQNNKNSLLYDMPILQYLEEKAKWDANAMN